MRTFLNRTMALLVTASLTPVGALASTLEGEVAEVGNRFDFTSKQSKPAVDGVSPTRVAGSGKIGGPGLLVNAAIGKRAPSPVPPPRPDGEPDRPRGFWNSLRSAARQVVAFAAGAAAGVVCFGVGAAYVCSGIGPLYGAARGHDEGTHGGGFGRNLVEQLKAPATLSVLGFQLFREGINEWGKYPFRR